MMDGTRQKIRQSGCYAGLMLAPRGPAEVIILTRVPQWDDKNKVEFDKIDR